MTVSYEQLLANPVRGAQLLREPHGAFSFENDKRVHIDR